MSSGHAASSIFFFSDILSYLNKSQSKKVSIINRLLSGCQAKEYCEAKYIIRSLEGKLRIGNAEKSVLVALAHSFVLAEKDECRFTPASP